MNQIPENLLNRASKLFEIPTNTEGKSYWYDRGTKEVRNTGGEHTGIRCHWPKQVLPGFIQDMNPLGFPLDETAQYVADTLLFEVLKKLPGVTVEVRDHTDQLTNLAPIVTEDGEPAKYLHVVLKLSGKTVDHAVAMLLYKILGYRTLAQAYDTNVSDTVTALTASD